MIAAVAPGQEERAKAIALWAGFLSIGAAISPLLGGAFAEHGDWRGAYAVVIGAAVLSFLITFAASYAADCTDAEWCALVEHELYHVAHARGLFGEPLFTKEGRPRLEIRGHDVEEFVGVVRRYGTGNPEGNLARLVEAAGRAPEVSRLQVAGACGTCLLRAA